jgi:hypothetical protein
MNERTDTQLRSHIWAQNDTPSNADLREINHGDVTEETLPEIHALPFMRQRVVYLTLFQLPKSRLGTVFHDIDSSYAPLMKPNGAQRVADHDL